MGTRSLTFVYNDHKEPIINLYRQYDGYPSGHGAELAEFLAPLTLVNGFGRDTANLANGMGCLAAQMVSHFKKGCGTFYVMDVEDRDCGQDYEYHIYQNEDKDLCVRVKDRGWNAFGLTMSDKDECIFDGPIYRFEEFCEEE